VISAVRLLDRAKRATEVAKRRNAEANDAYDFRYFGDEEGRHSARCLFAKRGGPACARDYILFEEPDDPTLYEGTGIGALYGLPNTDQFAYLMAGWTILRRPRTGEENR